MECFFKYSTPTLTSNFLILVFDKQNYFNFVVKKILLNYFSLVLSSDECQIQTKLPLCTYLPTYYLFLSFLIALKAKIGYVILSTYNMQILSRYVMKIRARSLRKKNSTKNSAKNIQAHHIKFFLLIQYTAHFHVPLNVDRHLEINHK